MSSTVDRSARAKLEQTIIDQSWQVDTSLIDATWLDSLEFNEFMQAWDDLGSYYEANPDDGQIGIEALQEHFSFTRLLRTVSEHEEYDSDRQQQAAAVLKELEQIMDGITSSRRRS
jgi:hypothetical protein